MSDIKIGHIIIALAAAALAASCSIGTIDESQAPLVYREFTATLDPSTRTGLDANLKVLWDQSGESITIVDEQGIGYKLNQQSVSSDRRTATFSGAVPASGCILAVYPSQDNIDYDDGALTLTLPHEQAPIEGSFASGANITVSKVSGNNLSFKNICGILSFTVNADNVTSISLSAEEQSGGALTGAAVVGFEGENPYALSDSQSGKKHVELKGTVARGKRYMAIVYPGTYGNLKLIFTDSKGRTASFDRSTPITVQRSKIVNISPITINESDWKSDTSSDGTFKLVTSASSLQEGDEVLIVYNSGSKALGAISSNGNYRTEANVTISDNTIADPSTAVILTLEAGSSGSTWSFKDGSNYLSSSSSGNNLQNSTSKNAYSSWSVSINSSNDADIKAQAGASSYIRYNISATRFSCYNSNTNQQAVSIYRRDGASSGPFLPTVTTLPAENISMADATLYA